jgi:4-coumarate--CoA ligase
LERRQNDFVSPVLSYIVCALEIKLTASGLTAILHCNAWDGLQAVILERFSLQEFLDTIQKYKITFAFIVPPIVLLLAKDPSVDKYDVSSLKMMNSGAAP